MKDAQGEPSLFAPISRRSLSGSVVEGLRNAIYNRDLLPGTRLVEQELAKKFDVSRGPIRDAFFELESEGLITFSTGRGRFVVDLNFNDLQEIYSLRTTLEELAIELACERADQGDFDRLKVIIIQMEKMVQDNLSVRAALDLDLAFHEAIILASKHTRLFGAWQNLRPQIKLTLLERMESPMEFSSILVQYHQELMDLIVSSDKQKARQEIKKHLASSFRPIVEARVS